MTGALPPPPNAAARVTRRLSAMAGLVSLLYAAVFGGQVFGGAAVACWWPPVAAILLLPLPALLVAAGRSAARAPARIARCAAVGYLAALATYALAWNGTPADGAMWLASAAVLPCLAAALVWPLPWVACYALVTGGACRGLSAATGTDPWTVIDLVGLTTNTALCLVLAGLARLAVDAAARLDATWAAGHAAAAADAADRARAAERLRVGDLLHDWVLATLLAAARHGQPAQVRRQAALALGKLGPPEPAGLPVRDHGAVLAALRTAVDEADPELRPVVRGTGGAVPAAVVAAMAEGIGEAVRNSRRHAGPAARTVTVTAGTGRLDVEISDDGTGFDTVDGYGLRRLRERFRELPGAAVAVDSTPGRGTTVRMRWRAVAEAPPAPADFRALAGLGTRVAVAAVLALTGAAAVCAAAAHPDVRHLPAAIGTVLLVAAAAVALVVDRGDPLPPRATVVAVLGLPAAAAVLLAVLAPPFTPEQLWPFFLVTSFGPLLCFRGRPLAGLLTMLLCDIPAVLAAAGAGQPAGLWIAESVAGLGSLFMGLVLTATLRPVLGETDRLRRDSAARHAAVTAETTAADERRRYLAVIDRQARGLLEHLATGPLTSADRRAAALLEARLRGLIRAPGLAGPEIADPVDRARERGVEILLIDDSAAPRLAAAAFARFATLLAAELAATPPGASVTVRLAPDHHPHPATVVITRGGETLRRVVVDGAGHPIGTIADADDVTRNSPCRDVGAKE